jgi:hypothetical protein
MKIILLRFENENINFLEIDIDSGNLIIGKKEKIPLLSTETKGEKYNKVMDELFLIYGKYSPEYFAYHHPQKMMGRIMDEEGFANSVIFNLFCYQNGIKLLEITPPITRKKLGIKEVEFNAKLVEAKKSVSEKYGIAKSDKIVEGLALLSLLKEII